MIKNQIKRIIPKKIYKYIIIFRDNMKYIFIRIKNFFNPDKYKNLKILSNNETIELIIKEKKSLCRFGDGEFKWILKEKQDSFQEDNEILSAKLLEVLTSNQPNILIAIPDIFDDLSFYNRKAKIFWTIFLDEEFEKIKPMLNYDKKYANTEITRPYIDYKSKKDVGEKYNNLKKIWDKRNILIIEGSNTKLGVRNDLLANAKSIKRIICPPTNAFSKYKEILEETKKIPKDNLVLISLGPTATVLAYDLAVLGYQAIDTGHIDIEYEWFLSKVKNKSKVEGKAVNEAGTSNLEYKEYDTEYLESIISIIEG